MKLWMYRMLKHFKIFGTWRHGVCSRVCLAAAAASAGQYGRRPHADTTHFSAMSFTDIEEDLLINLVAKYPTIYDSSHADYRDVSKKENLWELIGEELGKSSEDCKKRWKLIRDGYQRFKRKCNLPTGSGAPRNSKHNRHEQLSFLEGIPQRRPGGSNIPESQGSHRSHTNSPQGTVDTDDSNDEEDKETNDILEEHDKNSLKDPDQKVKLEGKRSTRGNSSKLLKYRNDRDIKMHKLLKMVTKKKDDDVDFFCRHVAEVLRSLPPVYKAEAKKHISVIVSNFEIKAAQIQENTLLSDMTHSRRSSSSMSQYS